MSIFKNKKGISNHSHSPIKHMLHMVLCCGLPVIIIFAIPFIAGFSPAIAGVLAIITPFICPIMMGGMLIMMFRGNKSSCCEAKTDTKNEITQNDRKKN